VNLETVNNLLNFSGWGDLEQDLSVCC